MKIKLLSPLLANQIAAGEVVERPASVVKELLENSLDAGATTIDIRLREGGKKLIQIRDNGEGVDKEDLLLAVSRHATSKISETKDLAAIQSLGFRGEALASICSVAQLTMSSKTDAAELAWQVCVQGQDLAATITPSSHPRGTSVTVKDLFFNTPARRKFLRAPQTELAHIDELVRRFSLSHFNVAFNLFHDEALLRQFPIASTQLQKEKRLLKIFGQRFIQQAQHLEMSATSLKLTGWVGLPEFSRQQSDMQYFYVNGRIVRDRLLNHAVRLAYEDKLPVGRYAAYALYLEIDPAEVDVNVHPTKHEVRFQQSRLVHDFIVSSLRKALVPNLTPVTETTTQLTMDSEFLPQKNYSVPSSSAYTFAQAQEKYNQFVERGVNSPAPIESPTKTGLQLVGTTQDKFAIYETPQGIAIVEIAAICQHFLLQTWQAQWQQQGRVEKQLLLIPLQIPLSTPQIEVMANHADEFHCYGIEYSVLGQNGLLLRALPKGVAKIDWDKFITEVGKNDFRAVSLLTLMAKAAEPLAVSKTAWLALVDEQLLAKMPKKEIIL